MADKGAPAKKKMPERRCIGCGAMKPKAELIRVVRSPEGDVSVDLTGKKSGRGAYICRSASCLSKAVKKGQLARNLGVSIPDEIADRLRLEIENDG